MPSYHRSAGGADAVIAEVCNLMLPVLRRRKYCGSSAKTRSIRKAPVHPFAHDYLNFLLTGNYVAECGDASGTALFNGIRREWSPAICNIVDPGLFRLFLNGRIRQAAGTFPECVRAFWLPGGIPVSSGGATK
jgi:xylulokinase